VAFGRDRRLPITSRWREHRSGEGGGGIGAGPEGAQTREARETEELS
jgi:hypothetical protein